MLRLRALPAAALLLAACHQGAAGPAPSADYIEERGIDREAVLLSRWRPTAPQRCQIARYPETLPAAEALISTADMPVLLEQGGIRDARGASLVSLKFDSTGRLERLRTIETTLDEGTAAVLERALLSAVQPQRPGRAWGARLRVELDSTPRYRVGRREHCAAAMLPLPGGAGIAGPSGTSPISNQFFSLKFAISLDDAGTVVDVRPIGGNTQEPTLVEAMAAQLRRMRFLPERDDGVPVPTVIEQTQRLRMTTVVRPI